MNTPAAPISTAAVFFIYPLMLSADDMWIDMQICFDRLTKC